MSTRKIVAAAGIAGALIFTSACSASETTSAAATSGASDVASAATTPSATPTPTTRTLPNGLVAKGLANDGKGDYLQTSIADTDPAMQYNPAIADDAAKAHFSEADLAEAQKVIVRFIAEEAIDSTLNDGTDVDGWWAAHKDQILPENQPIMLKDLKNGKDVVAHEAWMIAQPDLSYAHGADTPRVANRTIKPLKLRFVENGPLKGVMLDTHESYSMAVNYGLKTQPTSAELSFAAAKDPADGKWKIAGYSVSYHTTEYKIGG